MKNLSFLVLCTLLFASCGQEVTPPTPPVTSVETETPIINTNSGNSLTKTDTTLSGSTQCVHIIENATGPTYSPDSKSYFYIVQKNRRPVIVQVRPDGEKQYELSLISYGTDQSIKYSPDSKNLGK